MIPARGLARAARGSKRTRRRLTAIDKKELPTVYLMLAPAVLLLTIFVVIPLFIALERSFYDWTFYKESTFVGWDSYRIIVTNHFFQQSVKNAFKFVLIIVPLMMLSSFGLAHLIRGLSPRMSNIYKGIVYIPTVVSGIAASVIFIFVLDFRAGVINQVIVALGGERIPFMTSAAWATMAVSLITVWLGFGANTILMYAALANVPAEYYEAASIDGANRFQKLIYVTLPQMKNIFVLIAVQLTTGTLQMFDIPYLLTGGGPRNQTLTPMLYLYNNYRDATKGMGYTIAGALLMMVIITAINSLIFRVIRSEKLVDG